MKSRILLSITILGAFALGFLTVRPVAQAMQAMGITLCSSTGTPGCIGGTNSGSGSGVSGKSAKGNGVYGQTTAVSGSGNGVYGNDETFNPGNSGVNGFSKYGSGVDARSEYGMALTAVSSGAGHPYAALNVGAPFGADVVNAAGANGAIFKVDTNANLTISGKLYTSGSCSTGCSRTMHERSYGTTAAAPTIEDTGEGRLTGGVAQIRLDPAFANAIDRRHGYVVLITPEGDTRGLFVAGRSASGFLVREVMGGRSDIAFAYRIVAHPFGDTEPRLPMVHEEAPVIK